MKLTKFHLKLLKNLEKNLDLRKIGKLLSDQWNKKSFWQKCLILQKIKFRKFV